MNWSTWGRYAKRSDDGNFSISKAKVREKWVYTLWVLKKGGNECESFWGSFREAEGRAEVLAKGEGADPDNR